MKRLAIVLIFVMSILTRAEAAQITDMYGRSVTLSNHITGFWAHPRP